MAFYAEEEEVWKCTKHPSKRRRTGICPSCLKDRLGSLCPDCAAARPCACCPAPAASTSSSSSSSSFSLFSAFGSRRESSTTAGVIDGDPAFRRSRSVAIPFLRSQFPNRGQPETPRKSSSFWSAFKIHQKGRESGEDEKSNRSEAEDNSVRPTMRRSKTVTSWIGDIRSASRRGVRGWHFPSPMSVFWYSKSKVVHDRSPLHRG